MGHLDVRLLGPFQVTLDGESVTGFRSDKVRALLAYLCTETAGPQRREKLAGILWPDWPESSARANLRRALADLRSVISDRDATPPFLSVTPQTIAFNTASDAWVDVAAFADLTGEGRRGSGRDPARLEQAVALYQGEFLGGFSLADSPTFGEWVLFNRERWHRLVLDALQRLVQHYRQSGEYERGLGHAWRQVELDPWREEAHQQVMRLLAFSGRRGAALAQYETCRRVLAEELHVEPAPETTRLYEQIRDGTMAAPAPSSAPPLGLEVRHPAFLDDRVVEAQRPIFVARDREMARLDGFLEMALAGQGRVVFITGGPGRGKTALLEEFARRAMAAHPELLVATGKCNALVDAGEPYLPFRELLAMLTGDVEARWAAGSIGRDHARRLWAALPIAAQALAECGPYVTGILLDGSALLSRAAAATELQDAPWLVHLQEQVERQRAHTKGLEQSHLVEQTTNVLYRLASSCPLLLIVDDLQWVDVASTGLLFHLGRRLPGHRILVACAYRPEEVSLAGQRDHPLAKVLAELKRQFGEAWIDLSGIDGGDGQDFIDALLDAEPNRLGRGFRDALLQRTAGHPLFTLELLRGMQERRDLQRDEEGRWVEGPALRWETLPARVEGAIGQRIERLAPELKEILAVACVEGEVFTAQVIANVQESDLRQVLRMLTTDLQRQHRLVQAQDEQHIGSQNLSHYRFGHVLFRDYLYSNLSPGERGLLHRRVGTALEALYEGKLEEIAARLVHHFAGDPEKEQRYARLAGERAAAQYANEEALLHLSHALELTPESDLPERFALLLAREQVYDRQSDRDAQRQDLAVLEEVAAALADPQKQAEVALRQASCAYFSADITQCMAFAQAAAGLAQSLGNPELEARAHRLWAMALGHLGQQEASIRHQERSLALARAAGDRWLEAETLRQLSWNHLFLGEHDQAAALIEASLAIFQQVGDQHDQMRVRHNLAVFSVSRFDYQQAREHWEEGLRLSRELGARHHEAAQLHALAGVPEACGQYAAARDRYRGVLSLARDIGAQPLEGRALVSLGCMSHALGESEQALPYIRQALALARESGEPYLEAYVLTALGHCRGSLGELKEAKAAYQEALSLRWEMAQFNEATEAQAGLARVCLAAGDLAGAMGYVEDILSHLERGTLEGTEQPLLVYLTCYQVLQEAGDVRAPAVLEEGYLLLQEIADKFTDPELRRSFLENVAAHRELAQEYEQVRGER